MKFLRNKKKILKYLLVGLGIGAISTSIVLSYTLNHLHKNNNSIETIDTNNLSSSNNYNYSLAKNSIYSMRENPVINLGDKYADKEITRYASDLSDAPTLRNEIINSLKKASYWKNNEAPTNVDFKINSTFASYKNGVNTGPAISVTPIIDGTTALNDVIVSLIGLKIPTGITYPIDTMNGVFDDENNQVASFEYLPPISSSGNNILTSQQLKEYLFNNPTLFGSIFANLPEIGTINGDSITTNGDFILHGNSVQIDQPTVQEDYGQYKVVSYPMILSARYYDDDGVIKSTTLAYEYTIKVYYPKALLEPINSADPTMLPNTTIANMINAKQNSITANDFSLEFENDPQTFEENIIQILKADTENVIELPASLNSNDIEIRISNINNDLGLLTLNIVFNKVKHEGEETNDKQYTFSKDITFYGFRKVTSTNYTNIYSVANLSGDIATKYPSEFAQYDVLEEIANTTSTITNQMPFMISSGSFNENSNASLKAKMFKAAKLTVNYDDAVFDDNKGTISNIRVTINGYYNENNIYTTKTTKQLTLTLCNFKSQNVNGVTTINQIRVSDEYSQYPAQSFLLPKEERLELLQQGYLPPSSSNDVDNLNQDEIKTLISENVVNLPNITGNEINNWKLKDLKINNFEGEITGKVYFPYYYSFDENSNYIITKNFSSTAQNAHWENFTITNFAQVPGETTIDYNFVTEKYITNNDFGPVEISTSQIKLSDYVAMIKGDEETNARNIINYWVLQKAKIIGNRWDTFSAQFANTSIGLQSIKYSHNYYSNSYSINFQFYYFNSLGEFVISKEITIQMTNFKTDDVFNSPTIINAEFPLSLSTFSSDFSNKLPADFKDIISDGNNPLHNQLMQEITEKLHNITSNYNNKKLPQYQITVANDNENYPGSIFINVKLKNNYWDSDSQWVDNNVIQNTNYLVQIEGFQVIGSTTLSEQIIATKEITTTADEQTRLASEAAQDPTLIEELKKLVINNIYNPVANAENPIHTQEIPNFNNSSVVAANGIEYFGEVNDVDGTITLKVIFNKNKWYKDSKLQDKDGEFTTVISGFKKLTNLQWYNKKIEINTNNLRKNINGDNIIADNICGIIGNGDDNVSQPTAANTLNKIERAILSSDNEIIENVEKINLKMDTTKNIAYNLEGEVQVSLSAYGANVVDPNTGLYYTNEANPYRFTIIVSGFTKVTPTAYAKSLFLNNVSDNVPFAKGQIYINQLAKQENIVNLFGNTLPVEFYGNDAERWLREKLWIPDQDENSQDNYIYDYANGTVTIKQIVLLSYFDENGNLVLNKDVSIQENWNWTEAKKNKYLLIEDLQITGFRKVNETTINKTVTLNNMSNILASEYIEKNKDLDNGGTTIAQIIANSLIYTSDESNAPSINNLPDFINNYDNSAIPEFEASNLDYNNKEGTISFDLKITNNFFYLNDDGILVFMNKKDSGLANDKYPQTRITIKGFKTIQTTSINQSININNLILTTSTELDKNRKDLFWYNIIGADGTFNETIEKILSLIYDYQESFINNLYGTIDATNISEYMEIASFDYTNSNFATGTLSFELSLFKYIDDAGKVVDTSTDPTASPLTANINISGFSPSGVTSSRKDQVEININSANYNFLKDIDFRVSSEGLNYAFAQAPISDNGIPIFLENNFSSIPPSTIFKYKDNDKLVDIRFELDPVTSENIGADSYRTGSIYLKNVIVDNGGKRQISAQEQKFSFKLVGFGNLTKTEIKKNIWDLNTNFSEEIANFDNGSIAVGTADTTKIEALLNQSVIYQDTSMPIFATFMRNPIINSGNSNTELDVIEVIENIPSTGTIIVKVRYRNAYKQSDGSINHDWSEPETITLSGFRVITTTTITNGTIQPATIINLLPSEIKNNTEVKAKLIESLNIKSNINTIFTNANVNASNQRPDIQITNIEIISVNDRDGSINVKLTYKNYFDNSGIFNETEYTNPNPITIINLNKYAETQINATTININDYFGNISLPTSPSNIQSLIPSQYVGYINAELIKAQEEGVKGAELIKIFDQYFGQLIRPIYDIDAPTTGQDNSLNFSNFRIATNTNLFSSSIFYPGVQLRYNGSTYEPINSSSQKIDSLYTAMNYNLIKNDNDQWEFNVRNAMKADDRLGTITIDFKIKGMWTFNSNNEIYKPNESDSNIKDYSLTISGFSQDIENEVNLTTAIIISSSVGGGLLLLILLIAFIVKLRKFGVGY